MPTIITADELRAVVGVSVALYPDAYLDDVIDTAENVVIPLLEVNKSGIEQVQIRNNVAYCFTVRRHKFAIGSSLTIAGCGAPFDGSARIVTGSVMLDYGFTFALTSADTYLTPVIPNGTATLSGAGSYAGHVSIKTAVKQVSVEVFQALTAAGGQSDSFDGTPAPFKLGRSLHSRIMGLLSNDIDVETIAQ